LFFVSVDSKELGLLVSPLKSTLADICVSVDSKEVAPRDNGAASARPEPSVSPFATRNERILCRKDNHGSRKNLGLE
jgi:hypothetical protein